MTSVTILNSVVIDNEFDGCTRLTSLTIGNGVKSIGSEAFYKCTSLTSVTIPDSVTSIGGEAFGDCSSLTSIVVDPNNRVYSSQDGVLYDKAITVIIKYPCGKSGGFTIPSSITSIGNYAFYNCTSLTSVTIPDSVTSIGNSAFKGCASLTSVTILNSVVIDNEFDGCTSLTNVTIGNGVTSIGNYAFYNCTSLTSAYFLGNAPEMGQSVFRGCSSSFVVCFTAGSTGFTPPSWDGYPAAVCEEPTSSTTTVPSTTSTIQSTTTTTVPANLCAAEAIYGSNSEETELLRRYRDKVLSKSASGRQMIKTYYELSPAVAEVLQNNEAARENARKVLDSLMPAIREKVKQ
ncbi:MAG: leucine-rich repeat domain-containing protein [Proteobacteria bacterium]|nr:leucine-rich repeat domain-containing protein [Pseudomonadota bacterium]